MTFNLRDFFRMRKILDVRVAILATKNSVSAGRVFLGMDRNIPPFFGFHSRLSVASQARSVLLQRLCSGCLLGVKGRQENAKDNQPD